MSLKGPRGDDCDKDAWRSYWDWVFRKGGPMDKSTKEIRKYSKTLEVKNMKSENTILEELTFPTNYISSLRDVLSLVEKAFEDGVFFKNKVYAAVQGNQMFLILNGLSFPFFPKESVVDARTRVLGDGVEVITESEDIKKIIQSFDNKTKALYWWILSKYAETTILKTQAATTIYAVLGENGVIDNVMNPSPTYVNDFIKSHESCEDDDDDDDDDEEEDDDPYS